MTKSKREEDKPESEDVIMERMNKALKRMMETPPEAHIERWLSDGVDWQANG